MVRNNIIFSQKSPIADYVDNILTIAVHERASDIHFERYDDKFSIRYRINGSLVAFPDNSIDIAEPVISRLKMMAGLNISESRMPQDGSIPYTIDNNIIDFRISCLPTQFGESIVLRVLNNACDRFELSSILAKDPSLQTFLTTFINDSGLVLFVGPTGCGKSTTMYSVLRAINTDDIKILTCEDPVEQHIDGITQCQIRQDIGFTFASAIRSFLRHDPDVIFIGEIRDSETAQLAIRAAITGHAVFATLHANDINGAIPRLIDLGANNIMVANAVRCIVHQQLEVYYNPEHHQYERTATFNHLFVDKALQKQILDTSQKNSAYKNLILKKN